MLRAELLPPDVHRGAADAMRLALSGLVVTPVWVQRVSTMLKGSGVRVCAAVSYPQGTSKSTIKAIEATSCIKDGADSVWIVPHLSNVLRADFDAIKFELLEIARAARSTRRDAGIHVMLQSFAGEALGAVCRAARESGCDGIIATSDEGLIAQLRQHAEELSITADAVQDLATAHRLTAAGADRIASERATGFAVQSTGE